jgi:hypothetical protein
MVNGAVAAAVSAAGAVMAKGMSRKDKKIAKRGAVS